MSAELRSRTATPVGCPPPALPAAGNVPPHAWNRAVAELGGDVFVRSEWLRALLAGGLVDADAAHVVRQRGGRVTALAACLVTRRCPKLEMFREYYLHSPFAGRTLGVVHSMYAQRSHLLAESEHERALLLDELEEQCARTVGSDGLLLPLVADGDPTLDLVRERGYAIGLLSCTNLLPVRWQDFSGYLTDRPSAKRRNILRSLATAEGQGVTMAVYDDDTAVSTLAALVADTSGRHGSPLFFDERFLRVLVRELGTLARTFVVFAQGRPLLACLALVDRGELVPWCIGMDYTELKRYDHYNYFYGALIRYAIEQRLESVNFGRSTYVIKRKFGCVQRPVYAAMTGPAATERDRRDWMTAIDRKARDELAQLNLRLTADGGQVTTAGGEHTP